MLSVFTETKFTMSHCLSYLSSHQNYVCFCFSFYKTPTIMVRCADCFLHRDEEVNGRDPLPGIFSLYLQSSIHFVAVNYCEQSFVCESFVSQTMKGGTLSRNKTQYFGSFCAQSNSNHMTYLK